VDSFGSRRVALRRVVRRVLLGGVSLLSAYRCVRASILPCPENVCPGLLLKVARKVNDNPTDAKYRRLRMTGAKIARMWQHTQVQQLMGICGWSTTIEVKPRPLVVMASMTRR